MLVGSRTQACPRGRIDASACPSDLVWNKDVNALIASSFIFPAGRGGFASRRDVQHKRAVKIADKLAHSVRVPVFLVVHQDRNRASAFALRQSEALAMIERQRGAIALAPMPASERGDSTAVTHSAAVQAARQCI